MKKIVFLFLGTTLFFHQSCSRTAEAPPSEMSIESVSSATGEKVLIRLKPKVGDTQKMLMTLQMNSQDSQAVSMNLAANLGLKVAGKEEDVYDYELKYNSIKMDMNAGGIEINYDSQATEQTGMGVMIHEQMKEFFTSSINMKMNERGKVSSLSLPGNMASQQMGDMGSMSIPMPEDPVGEGDSWSAERPLEGAGTMKMNMKLEKVTVSDILIGTSGDIQDNAGNKIGGFEGNYKLDRNSGLTKDGTMKLDMNVEGQSMKMNVNFKSI